MLIPDSFRQAYDAARVVWEPIKAETDGIMHQMKAEYPDSQYRSRIKPIDSTLLKTQKGDYDHPLRDMEDFLAATIVLPNLPLVSDFCARLEQHFECEQIRVPREPLRPESFPYNDLHFLLSLKDSPLRADKSVLGMRFELQVKTLLQAAWSQATHEAVYKPARISWALNRIASQLRALLELADSILAKIEDTSSLLYAETDKDHVEYQCETRATIELLEANWDSWRLPSDRRRMADIVRRYLEMSGLSVDDLGRLIQEARAAHDPLLDYLTITPMDQVFVLLYRKNRTRCKGKLASGKSRVLVTPEMAEFYPELGGLKVGLVCLDTAACTDTLNGT